MKHEWIFQEAYTGCDSDLVLYQCSHCFIKVTIDSDLGLYYSIETDGSTFLKEIFNIRENCDHNLLMKNLLK